MVSNIHIDPFDRVKTYSIGFDRMFNSLLDAPASTGYPPYNIVKTSEEKYCIDIITQASAIKEALSGVEDLMLEHHLSTHVVHQMKRGSEKKAIDEILKVYKLAQKKK